MTIFQYPKCVHGHDYGTCHICEGAGEMRKGDGNFVEKMGGEISPHIDEREYAIVLANRILSRVYADPDDALAVLARQFLRAIENAATEREKIAVLERDSAELLAALEALLGSAVTLSREYLEQFRDKPLDATIQGWDKARWLRAADAADQATAVIAKAKGKA